jgi:hydroxymethylglutaryl-CoA lyase
MGGCPFIDGATGNVATEDTVYLLDGIGVETGIDRDAVADASLRVESFLGKTFPGKLHGLRRRETEAVSP